MHAGREALRRAGVSLDTAVLQARMRVCFRAGFGRGFGPLPGCGSGCFRAGSGGCFQAASSWCFRPGSTSRKHPHAGFHFYGGLLLGPISYSPHHC